MTFDGKCVCPEGKWLQRTTNLCMECDFGYAYDPKTEKCEKQTLPDPCKKPGDVFDTKGNCCPTHKGGWLNKEGVCQPTCLGTIIDYKCYENCDPPKTFDFTLK
jgi:hypothetical protein